ncbi:Protein of unknown function [Pyronema omphalodes CBS 100304]|uniref:Uncharacterized protein n=1 Tax=Pyronema omphalodes (strain CBS 100304) TaxID=1076935 RepID=U4LBK3_PYROM|nr:Protein of unknown function [Pyronema omphalodes CBS 100304]
MSAPSTPRSSLRIRTDMSSTNSTATSPITPPSTRHHSRSTTFTPREGMQLPATLKMSQYTGEYLAEILSGVAYSRGHGHKRGGLEGVFGQEE